MTFYFSADGTMKFTTNTVAPKGNLADDASKNLASKSKFSAEMKNAAMSKSGQLTSADKKALLANNTDYQRFAMYQARINEIASRKPRTFSDDDYNNYTMNTSVLTNYNALIAKRAASQKPRTT